MRRVAAGIAALVLLLSFAGCPGGQKVKDLEAQVEEQQQKIAELDGQVQTLTAERDSLQMLVDELSAKKESGKQPTEPTKKGGTSGGRTPLPPTKKGGK